MHVCRYVCMYLAADNVHMHTKVSCHIYEWVAWDLLLTHVTYNHAHLTAVMNVHTRMCVRVCKKQTHIHSLFCSLLPSLSHALSFYTPPPPLSFLSLSLSLYLSYTYTHTRTNTYIAGVGHRDKFLQAGFIAQKSPIICGWFLESDVQDKSSSVSGVGNRQFQHVYTHAHKLQHICTHVHKYLHCWSWTSG